MMSVCLSICLDLYLNIGLHNSFEFWQECIYEYWGSPTFIKICPWMFSYDPIYLIIMSAVVQIPYRIFFHFLFLLFLFFDKRLYRPLSNPICNMSARYSHLTPKHKLTKLETFYVHRPVQLWLCIQCNWYVHFLSDLLFRFQA